MLYYCIESLVQKLQQQGVVVKLEKYGSDPAPIAANHEGNNVDVWGYFRRFG